MLFVTIIKTALRSIRANKLRSFLAMLGIIIGVGAVISMLSIGAGARKNVMDRISSMGTNLLSIRSTQRGSRGVMSGSFQNLTLDDAMALLTDVPSIEMVSPEVSGGAQMKYYNKNTRTNISGTAITYPIISNSAIEYGRFFTETEVDRMARVTILGSETATNLGITEKQIGEQVKINGINFEVIGILKEKGGGGFFNPDDHAIVPYTTAMQILFGTDSLRSVDIKATKGANLNKVENAITALLRKRHRITNPDNDDFRVFNQAEIIATASEFNKTFTVLLGGIATISLLVGGIGIMNIMLVAVTERTREIGIRKAIGAKDRDIRNQFLIESLFMSGVGGLIGVLGGVVSSKIIGSFSNFTTVVDLSSIILAFSFSVAVGVFFGYYPAWRAALLDPIECLRYE